MTTKTKPVQPSLDTMTLRDLASLFALVGLLSGRSEQHLIDLKLVAETADDCADAWIERRART